MLLAVVISFVYANSVHVPFVLDDIHGILENPTIRTLWPLSVPLQPPADGGTVTNRPVVNLSLALNHALGGFAVEGYHVGNILIHIVNTLLLFGLLRRTLQRARVPESLRARSGEVALAIAGLWALHPLHTEAVTYVIQRAESLGALATLTTLYCFARSTEPSARRRAPWTLATLVACYLGMVTKETMVAAPVLVLLYDRTFASGSFLAAWRERRGFHLSLFASWAVLGWMIHQGQSRGGGVGFAEGVGPWQSLLTQCDAITMYLRLAFWPSPLVFDYGSSVVDVVRDPGSVVFQGGLLLIIGAGAIWALIRKPMPGFAGAWFFLILAPSSSVVPMLAQMRAEHRMYLPLAAIAALTVAAVFRWAGRWGWALCGALACVLGVLTMDRNRDYATPLSLWTDTVAKVPSNPRAHYNVGFELARVGRTTDAVASYAEAVRLDPSYLPARTNLATLLILLGRATDALPHAEAAVQLGPTSSAAHNILGRARFESGDAARGVQAFEEAVRLDPDNAGSRRNLGMALVRLGQAARALPHLQAAAQATPDAGLSVLVGETQLALGRTADARASFATAVSLEPGHGMAHFHLGVLLAEAGDAASAVSHLERAVHGMPRELPPLYNLGMALRAVGRTREAIACFERVLALDPRDAEAAEMLRTLTTGTP